MNLRHLFIAFFIIALSSCYRKHAPPVGPVSYSDVKTYLNHNNTAPAIWNWAVADCDEPVDTLYRNLPYNFEEAVVKLKSHFREVDALPCNTQTKQYIKSLIVADFTYAAFSFQLLGPRLGLAHDTVLPWQTIPISDFYELGNTNYISLYCLERTTFYLRLLDTLLNIKGSSISLAGIHEFPVVYIQKDTFIVDPFDPFVVYDSAQNNMLTYSALLKPHLSANIKPLRTRRLFGNSHQLISHLFVDSIKKAYCDKSNACFCVSLQNYFSKNEVMLKSKIKPCFELPEAPLYNTLKIVGSKSQYAYVMEMTGRVDGQLKSADDILRYYIGLSCDTGYTKK